VAFFFLCKRENMIIQFQDALGYDCVKIGADIQKNGIGNG
jgi:hypothetical protein